MTANPVDFTLTRSFDAPRALVFEAMTNADHLAKWWGPVGLTWIGCTMDLRPGGSFHYGMATPDGQEMWGKFSYREIAAPERLVFTNAFSNRDGGIVPAPFGDFPLEVLNTWIFEEDGDRAILSLHGTPLQATEAQTQAFLALHDSMTKGFGGTLDQLDRHLQGLQARA